MQCCACLTVLLNVTIFLELIYSLELAIQRTIYILSSDVLNKLLKFSSNERCRWFVYRILTIIGLMLYDQTGPVITKILLKYQKVETDRNVDALGTLLNHLVSAIGDECKVLT